MTDIVEFLTARLAADEEATEAATAGPVEESCASGADFGPALSRLLFHQSFNPMRVLAEVKAKRAILEQWQQADKACQRGIGDPALNAVHWATLRVVLVSLAGAHQAHPDYAGDNVNNWTWPDNEARRVK